ncbi:flagellar hook protein FlgE [Ideonella sp. A 288]|uniref:flagellar hook protein FlgE n=1 Tax=Ideonella sp. A 288 TaxID=1962181 RepID=UPI000B4A8234|nr:flagellar hook protein FlgE [Ideonella sp. A 288]
MAFQQGLSGLNTTSKNLGVIGNNIANANTYGNKSSRAEFADLYATSMNGSGSNGIGIGVNLTGVVQQFSQGNITTTQSTLDMAINGNGFFQLDNNGTSVYSRNGQFQVDKDGNVVNAAGHKLLGYAANSDGLIIPSTVQALKLPTAGVAPLATSEVRLEYNLDSREKIKSPAGAVAIDFQDPDTYNRATSIRVYDVKGQEVALTMYFQRTGDNTYDVYATANGKNWPDPANPATALVTGLEYDVAGTTLVNPPPNAPFTIPGGIQSVPLPDGGNSIPIDPITIDFSKSTHFGSGFSVTDLAQNGYAPGQLTGINIDKTGVIKAQYSNGESTNAGQVVLATFRNPQGLQPLGGNGWASSFASGDPIVGAPGQGNIGSVQSGALEESNVDLTAELVNMIVAQRSYQANAQTIKTEDQVLQTLVNLR